MSNLSWVKPEPGICGVSVPIARLDDLCSYLDNILAFALDEAPATLAPKLAALDIQYGYPALKRNLCAMLRLDQ